MDVRGLILLSCCSGYIASISEFGYDHPQRFDSSQDDKEILEILSHPSRYDKRSKPTGQHMAVNISVLLLSLSSPSESSLTYEVEFLMHQKWVDLRLSHTHWRGEGYGINGLAHHNNIWKPDIFLIKHGSYKAINPAEVNLRIFGNGTIFYTMRRHLILNCEGDLPIFPFDSPMCDFNVESISNTRDKMTFHWVGANAIEDGDESGSMTLSPVLKNHNAYLIHNETLYCDEEHGWRGDYSCLKVRLHFTRDKWFYYTTVFMPGMILVTSSFVTFWIEWNAEPARVTLGVTTMLNFFTTSNKFRSKLPVVSNLTAMNLWDGVCMFFIYASFIEFIMVNYLARWVQDPEQQKKKKENAILDNFLMASKAIEEKKQEMEATMVTLGDKVGSNIQQGLTSLPGTGVRRAEDQDYQDSPISEPALTSAQSAPVEVEEKSSWYTLESVKKIDNYSRRIFPSAYIIFVLYFFIRYHAIEGELSVHYYDYFEF